jgi:hypothetical protein
MLAQTSNSTKLFRIYDPAAAIDRFDIAANGNVGIGTMAPNALLTVGYGSEALTGNYVSVGSSSSNSGLIAGQAAGRNLVTRWVYNATPQNALAQLYTGGYANRLEIDASSIALNGNTSANVGIGTKSPAQKLEVSGTIRQTGCINGTPSANSSGDLTCSSDARLKNIYGPYKGGLGVLEKIDPQRFSFKPNSANPHERFVHVGFIAQNVRAVLPEASDTEKDGYYSLDTTAILAASVNAIKELQASNQKLEAVVLYQAAELRKLRADLALVRRNQLAQARR